MRFTRAAVVTLALIAACGVAYGGVVACGNELAVRNNDDRGDAPTNELDGGSSSSDGASNLDVVVAPRSFRYVFITSQVHAGKFSTTPSGGLAAADAFCKNVADTSPTLSGLRWHAWLSSDANLPDATAPPERISIGGKVTHDYRLLTNDGGFVLRQGFDFSVAGPLKLETLITINEKGEETLDASARVVWTGTNQDGTIATNNTCVNWTNDTASTAITGLAADPAQWCGATTGAKLERECFFPHALYCFEASE